MKVILPIQGTTERYPTGNLYQGFGENPHLYTHLRINGHNGHDYVKSYGATILAPHDGTIVEIKYSPEGYGNHIAIMSPEINGEVLVSILGHLTEKKLVILGQSVKIGDKVGEMGNSGYVVTNGIPKYGQSDLTKGGVHVHWTTRWYQRTNTGSVLNTFLGKSYLLLNRNNGFGGAFDPFEVLKMPQFKTQNYKGELRIVLQANNMETWEAICKVYGLDPKKIDEIIK